tara:strand:+ start:360 stop:707 length:348 start_codon:yes stop_codon:yes gene_type:complete
MTELNIKIFRFNGVNPTVKHESDDRVDLPAESSYLNVHIEYELPLSYAPVYENLSYITYERWADDDKIKVKYDANVHLNQITQAAYAYVEQHHEEVALMDYMINVITTLNTWKIL